MPLGLLGVRNCHWKLSQRREGHKSQYLYSMFLNVGKNVAKSGKKKYFQIFEINELQCGFLVGQKRRI